VICDSVLNVRSSLVAMGVFAYHIFPLNDVGNDAEMGNLSAWVTIRQYHQLIELELNLDGVRARLPTKPQCKDEKAAIKRLLQALFHTVSADIKGLPDQLVL
jgi:hypothetical protein